MYEGLLLGIIRERIIMIHKTCKVLMSGILAFGILLNTAGMALAEEGAGIPDDWPEAPQIMGDAAILMEAGTGTVLYEKNSYERHYPASITKIMTALLALENCSMDEMITFSHNSVYDIDPGCSIIGDIDEGDQLSMEKTMYGMMLNSGNEAAYGIAEHVAGDLPSFAEMMNQRARELGCLDTHFVNANGLHNDDHYTTAYDMALISREALKNEEFRKIVRTVRYTIEPDAYCEEPRYMKNHHKMLPGGAYEYPGCIGGKTGYTLRANQTLVTFAKRNGIELICVTLNETSPNQFLDTQALLDYGFDQFQRVNVADVDTRYQAGQEPGLFPDQFMDAAPFLKLNPSDYVVLPKPADFANATSEYQLSGNGEDAGTVKYYYGGYPIGSAKVVVDVTEASDIFPVNASANSGVSASGTEGKDSDKKEAREEKKSHPLRTFFIVIGVILGIAAVLFAAALIRVRILREKRRRQKRRKYRR
mgnify:CR=1 FL=1